MSFFDWAAPMLLDAGRSYVEGQIYQGANNRAADIAVQNAQQQLKMQQDAEQRANAQYTLEQQALQRLQGQASPAIARTNEIIARNPGLTPAQQLAVDEARRQTSNMLAASGQAGDARAVVAGVGKVAGDMRANFIDRNQSVSDQAALSQTGNYYNAGTNSANVHGQIAQNAMSAVQNQAKTVDNIGQAQVDQERGNAVIQGTAFRDISGLISDEMKNNAVQKNQGQYTGLDKKKPVSQQYSGSSFGG